MTTQVCEAIFQNGAFRPVQPISTVLAEGQHVRLVVEVEENDVLVMATSVYGGLSEAELTLPMPKGRGFFRQRIRFRR